MNSICPMNFFRTTDTTDTTDTSIWKLGLSLKQGGRAPESHVGFGLAEIWGAMRHNTLATRPHPRGS